MVFFTTINERSRAAPGPARPKPLSRLSLRFTAERLGAGAALSPDEKAVRNAQLAVKLATAAVVAMAVVALADSLLRTIETGRRLAAVRRP